MDSAQVGILEQTNKVGLGCFLKGQHCSALEPQIGLEVLSNFSNKALEGCLADQQIGRLLIFTDFTESNCSRAISVRFLHTSGGGCRLTSSLKIEMFIESEVLMRRRKSKL